MYKKLIPVFALLLLVSCGQSSGDLPAKTNPKSQTVETHVTENYLAKNGLIADYKNAKEPQYLSESIGLYMNYLVLNHDSQSFHALYLATKKELAFKKNFIKWKWGEEVTTNAFIDDMRLYSALHMASKQFHFPDYDKFASQIASNWKKYGVTDGVPVDFFDFKTKEKAKTLHLSYYNNSAMREIGFSEAAYEPLKKVQATPFFDEIFQDGSYQTTGNEVNMIDQMLIAIEYKRVTYKKEPHFDAFLQREWAKNNRVHARYNRDTKTATNNVESTAVYALLAEYYEETGQKENYQKATDKLQMMDTSNALTTHFFDYMHKELVLIKKGS